MLTVFQYPDAFYACSDICSQNKQDGWKEETARLNEDIPLPNCACGWVLGVGGGTRRRKGEDW